MIAMLMRQKHAIELFWAHPANFQASHQLARAQAAIHQQPAMLGRDQGRIPRAAAAENGEAEHAAMFTELPGGHKRKGISPRAFFPKNRARLGSADFAACTPRAHEAASAR